MSKFQFISYCLHRVKHLTVNAALNLFTQKTLFLTCSCPNEAPTASFHICTHETHAGQQNTFSRKVNLRILWKYVNPFVII